MKTTFFPTHATFAACLVALAATLAGCPSATSPRSQRPARAEKWFQRASKEYRRVAMDDAYESVRQALTLVPRDQEVRMLAARVALARLEFDEALKQLKGLRSACDPKPDEAATAASSLRGRALWYRGDMEKAADELECLLRDPDVKDVWAREITKLARRGIGRKPFDTQVTNGKLEHVEMARVATTRPYFVVPVEIDGEKGLGLVATGTPEVMIDSATRKESSWISLRFGERLEVRDVPALTRDLSAISREVGAPIRVLLGANLLRHINATLDHRGRQFVARNFIPPAPPAPASRVDVFYLRGGGMVLGASLGADVDSPSASLLVDTSLIHALALTSSGWNKVGVPLSELNVIYKGNAKVPSVRGGAVPSFNLGSFSLSQVPAVHGQAFEKLERELKINIDGAVGAGLLREYRLTFADGGRVLWVEDPPNVANVLETRRPPAAVSTTRPAPPRRPPASRPGPRRAPVKPAKPKLKAPAAP
jgi:tetratricopeptide (TPR) repeat protein